MITLNQSNSRNSIFKCHNYCNIHKSVSNEEHDSMFFVNIVTAVYILKNGIALLHRKQLTFWQKSE